MCPRCLGSGKYFKEVADESMQLVEVGCHLCDGQGSIQELETSDIGSRSRPMSLVLDREESEALKKFIFDQGYISHEFHPQIHEIFKKITKFLGD